MTDTNTTQTGGTAPDQASSGAQTMSQLIPSVARRLKNYGVTRVLARYEGEESVAFIIQGVKERDIPERTAVEAAGTLWAIWRPILERRYPAGTRSKGTSGYFEWNLAADTLQHEHTVTTTHHGL